LCGGGEEEGGGSGPEDGFPDHAVLPLRLFFNFIQRNDAEA
jgi:hypothetical protein